MRALATILATILAAALVLAPVAVQADELDLKLDIDPSTVLRAPDPACPACFVCPSCPYDGLLLSEPDVLTVNGWKVKLLDLHADNVELRATNARLTELVQNPPVPEVEPEPLLSTSTIVGTALGLVVGVLGTVAVVFAVQ